MDYLPDGKGLQAWLSAGSAISGGPIPTPHHPITCASPLALSDEGLRCEHAAVGPDDLRTAHAIMQSIAILLMEEAFRTIR